MPRAKRGRGEGGVYQRESDGLWVGTVSLGYDGKGKRKRKTVYGRSKKEALDKLRALQNSAASGRLPDAGSVTVGEFVATWLDGIKASVEPTTWARYDAQYRIYLAPHIGRVKLGALTPLHVSNLYATLLADRVSASMVRKIATTLGTALRAAVRMRIVPFNAGDGVAKPKAERKGIHVFTPEQVGHFLAAATQDRLEALYVVAVDSGCRQGELFALRWTDFDPAAGTLTIAKSLAELKGKLWVKDVKTKNGRRRVQLAFSLGVLHQHRERMRTEGQDVRAGLIFPDRAGGYLRKSNFCRRSFAGVLKRAGLPANTRFHDLRHCCASLLLVAGVDVKVVSERLGHGSAAFTMGTYQHVLPGLQQAAADRLKALLTATPKVVEPVPDGTQGEEQTRAPDAASAA
jgi:integrase